MKRLSVSKALLLSVMCVICLIFGSVSVYATDIEQANKQLKEAYGNINSQNSTSTPQNGSSVPDYGQGSVSDYLKGYTPVTQDNMNKASSLASPIVNFIGVLVGILCALTTGGVGLVTALDLLYIAVPPVRTFLYDGAGQQGGMQGGMGMGMGGMGMRGAGMYGGGMGMQGAGMQQGQKRFRWVSDEVVATVALCQPGGQSPAMAGGGMMGMGMMNGAPQQNMSTKSTISVYLKKRIFFLVLFAVATVVLLSSVFTDCGLNIAALVMKIMARINGSIGGAL